jgi:hypothetical protein
MSSSTASREQVAKVLEVLRSHPKGAMIEKIQEETSFTTDIIWSAIHALEREGTVVGQNPFAYEPTAVETDTDETEESK